MGWAAAIPVALQVLGAMSKEGEKQQAPAVPPPPTLGEMFAANAANYQPMQHSMPTLTPFTTGGPVGGGQK